MRSTEGRMASGDASSPSMTTTRLLAGMSGGLRAARLQRGERRFVPATDPVDARRLAADIPELRQHRVHDIVRIDPAHRVEPSSYVLKRREVEQVREARLQLSDLHVRREIGQRERIAGEILRSR